MAVGAKGVRAGRAYVELGVHDKLARGLRRAQARLKAFGASVTAIGMSLVKLGAVMAAPFALGAKSFASFDQQMRMVSTMLGDAAAKWMPGFRKAAKDMSVEFGQSIESISQGMYDLLSAQVPPVQMLEVLRVAMKGATGGMTDTATAVKAVVRIMRGFGMQAESAADISDVLFTIVEKGVINYEQLAESIGTVAPSAKAAGMTLDELAAAVATVVSVEEPKRAMTALRTGIFEAAEAGMDFLAFARKFKGADLGAIIQAGIPKKAAQGIVILAQNIELLDENIAAMANRAGAADAAYKKMAAGLMHSWNKLKAGARVIFIKIGQAIEKPLADAAAWLKRWASAIGAWIDRNRGLMVSLFKLAGIIIGVGVGLMFAGYAIRLLGSLFGVAAMAVKVFGAVLAFVLSPLGLVTAAVAGLGAYLLFATETGQKWLGWLGDAFGSLKEDASKSFDGIKRAMAAGDMGLAAQILWLTLKKWWIKGTGWLLEKWLAAKNKMTEWATSGFYAIAKIWAKVVSGLAKAWLGFAKTVKIAKSAVKEGVSRWKTEAAYGDEYFAIEEMRKEDKITEQEKDSMLRAAQFKRDKAMGEHRAAAESREDHIRSTYNAQIKAINDDEAAKLLDLSQRHVQQNKKQQDKTKADLAAIAARRKKVEEELAAALAKTPAGEGGTDGPPLPGNLKDMAAKIKAAMGGLGGQLSTAGVTGGTARGSFGAAALLSLQTRGGDAAARTAEATERIAKNTNGLRRAKKLAWS